MKYVIGIDPGLKGALAFFKDGDLIGVRDMPVMANPFGKGRTIDCIELAAMLGAFRGRDVLVIIESVGTMPKQGIASAFNFGRAAMAPEAIALAFGLSIDKVTPAVWKRKAKLIKKDKEVSLARAKTRWPGYAHLFRLKKHEGRAEAALIGYHTALELEKSDE